MAKKILKIRKRLKSKEAFTLIEMLIVLFIIAILLILIIPNITKNIDSAKDKSSEAYEKTVHYLEGPVEKASKAPNGKQIIISNGKATLQR